MMKQSQRAYTAIRLLVSLVVLSFVPHILVAQEAPAFSVSRGFYDTPFAVSLSTVDPDTKIYYTTDGTRPTTESTPYTASVTVSATTPLSAVGYKAGAYSPVVTHTYYFVDDITRQPQTPQGYPDRWGVLGGDVTYAKYKVGERAPAHYGMESEVCNDRKYSRYLKDAFLSIPSLGIVTTPGYLFSDAEDENEGGIYIHTGVKIGDGWERPISLEYIDPATGKQFQENCGLRIHGAASRQPEKSGKHSFRTYFKKIYGAGKLKFDLFETPTAAVKFDHLVLRAGFGYSWLHWSGNDRNYSQYIIDSFAKRTQLAMGKPAAHDRFVHLFINGLYWGLYDISERLRDNYMESYFGGVDVDYDVINHNGLADGDKSAFDRMVALAESGQYDELLSENLLDMENYIDYVLINFYMGNTDWGDNNWYAARNRLNPGNGFRFFIWDTENCFFSGLNFNTMTGAWRFKGPLRRIIFGSKEPPTVGGGLSQHQEFRLLFADRVQKHFFNGGVLSPEKAAERYELLADEVELPIILESARWGSYRNKTLPGDGKSPIYTRDDHWQPHKEKLLQEYFPGRTAVVYEQFRDLGLLPDVDAPLFSSYGAEVDDSFVLTMSAKARSVYYTTDGTDPRESGTGNIASAASRYSKPISVTEACTVKARAITGGEWSALSEAVFTREPGSNVAHSAHGSVEVLWRDNRLSITLPNGGDAHLDVYAVDGSCVYQATTFLRSGDNDIELSDLSGGVYIWRVMVNNKVYSGKFVR